MKAEISENLKNDGIPLHSRARGAEGPHWHTANKKAALAGSLYRGYTTGLQGNLNFEVQSSQFCRIGITFIIYRIQQVA